jgi:serine/threonine protein kinase
LELIRGRYEHLEVVGRGGQGEVIKALDHQHGRLVALKVRDVGSEAERAELLREANVLLSLTPRANLPLVREDFFEGDRYYIAMDWIEGKNLQQLVDEKGSRGLPTDQAVGYLDQLADALNHLHSHKPPVVHQDVKPANVVLTDEERLVLVDFGIASRSRSAGGRAMGTRGFTAPEVQAGRQTTPSADVFGLAATAFVLMTGRAPGADVIPDIRKAMGRPERRALKVIRRGLSIDPARRPPSVAAFMKALKDSLSSRIHYGQLARMVASIVAIGLVASVVVVLLADLLNQAGAGPPTAGPSPPTIRKSTVPGRSTSPSPTATPTVRKTVSPSVGPTAPQPVMLFHNWNGDDDFRNPEVNFKDEYSNHVTAEGSHLVIDLTGNDTHALAGEVDWYETVPLDLDWESAEVSTATATLTFEYTLQTYPQVEGHDDDPIGVVVVLSMEGAGCTSGQMGGGRLKPTPGELGPQKPESQPSISCSIPTDPAEMGEIRIKVGVQAFHWQDASIPWEIHLDLQLQKAGISFN